ncbi:unnamed protein product [Amoebophrya sp. A25]|nr:unnamed protein product [Amoebophrya sp. A25]|eukprot:GSA25T00019732001.1
MSRVSGLSPNRRGSSAEDGEKSALHRFIEKYWAPVVKVLSEELGPGPPLLKQAHLTNAFKAGTLPLCLGLMYHFQNFTPTAWTYTALHGSYGILWVLKEWWCPDGRFQLKMPFGSSCLAVSFLVGYWLAPIILISKKLQVSAPRQALCIFTYAIGVSMMLVADTQKFFALKYNRALAEQKKLLIKDGIFSNNRNPNYLGEMLLYGSFAGLVPHPLPKAMLAFAWLGLFSVNMFNKESSLMRKPGWEEYKKQSWLFLPKLFGGAGGSEEDDLKDKEE